MSAGDDLIKAAAHDSNAMAERDARERDLRSQLRMAESELLRALAAVERHHAAKVVEPNNPVEMFPLDAEHDQLQARVHICQATLYEVQAEAVLAGLRSGDL